MLSSTGGLINLVEVVWKVGGNAKFKSMELETVGPVKTQTIIHFDSSFDVCLGNLLRRIPLHN